MVELKGVAPSITFPIWVLPRTECATITHQMGFTQTRHGVIPNVVTANRDDWLYRTCPFHGNAEHRNCHVLVVKGLKPIRRRKTITTRSI